MNILSIIVVLWISKVTCFYRWSPHDNVVYREEILVKISQGLRTRRSADNSFHPQTYDLALKVERTRVHFHLERNDNTRTNVPTMTLRQGILTDTILQEEKMSEFYQDIKNGASFVVQQNKELSESMFGTFNSGDNSFILKSLDEITTIQSNHRFEIIKEIRNRTEFGDGLQTDDLFKDLPIRKHHRQKRATGSNQIELLIVCDYSIYDYWYRLSKASTTSEKETDALISVRQYYAFVINGMDAMYKNIQTTEYTISVLFAGIVISQTPDDAPWTESFKNKTVTPNLVDAIQCLYKFNEWIRANSSQLPERDQSMLFTRYDFLYEGSTSKAGLSFVGTICGENSQSIAQERFDFIVITVAAHELGHSLSAKHDGDGNSCNGTDAYIISYSNSPQQDPNKATNPWKFSTCSVDNFTLKIDAFESSGNNCMKTLGANFDPTALAPYNQSLAGQYYDADAQCSHIYGTSSYMCRGQYNGNYESICSVLWCYNQDETSCRSAIAGSGTLCGNHKWCVSGVCTSDTNAPAGNVNCLYGDEKGPISSNGWTCADMYANAPKDCENESLQCCETCYSELTTVAFMTSQGDGTIRSTMQTTDNSGMMLNICVIKNNISDKSLIINAELLFYDLIKIVLNFSTLTHILTFRRQVAKHLMLLRMKSLMFNYCHMSYAVKSFYVSF
ncbi:A disintegrin and metalloproteinase with thrombospondin motifs 7-like isoform X1 [Mytilus trossulus]|uniref:A disintegrin and metalloproteinase with thrombospondin motifs 7-like isoform X1 n=1 Tax=Mytilus trossulus TaxID=6551 RepID=UPI003007184F